MWGVGTIAIIGVAMLAASCSSMTPYQESGWTGAVQAHEDADGTWLVVASTNGNTPMEAATDYTYLKAAEITQAAGHVCFDVIEQNNEKIRRDVASGYVVSTSVAPVARLRIRFAETRDPCAGYGAEKLIAELRPRVADATFYKQFEHGK